jgi:hypothetical protein
MIPLMWAPYFINGGAPKETLDKLELLVAAIPVAYWYKVLLAWTQYACVAAGQAGPGPHQPSVAVASRDFPCDTPYNKWAKGWFQVVYRMAGQPPPSGGESQPAGDQSQRMAEAIVQGMKGATAAEKEKKEKYSAHKKVKILAACGLHEGEWEHVPTMVLNVVR